MGGYTGDGIPTTWPRAHDFRKYVKTITIDEQILNTLQNISIQIAKMLEILEQMDKAQRKKGVWIGWKHLKK